MSEDVRIAREFVKEYLPDTDLSDEEVVRLAFMFAIGYREGHESTRVRSEAEVLQGSAKRSRRKSTTRTRKGQ